MYYVHKFQDPWAREQAVIQTTREMIRLYVSKEAASILNSGPHPIDILTDTDAGTLYYTLQETAVLPIIDDWFAQNHKYNPTLDQVTSFTTGLVEEFAEQFRTRLAEDRQARLANEN